MSLDPATRVSLALRGRVLTPRSDGGLTVFPDGLLLADANGVIVQIGSYRSGRKRYPGPVRDLRDTVLIPGFVDAHVHYPQTRIIGRATGPLLDWLDTSVFPEEARLSRAAYAEAVAAEMIDRMIAMGTTSAAIFSSSSPTATERLFTHLAARGMRAAAGLTLMDVRSPKALKLGREPAMKAMRRLVRRWHGHDAGRLEVAVTPRFALSCSRAMLREAGRLARDEGLLVQTHVGETKQEGRLTLEAHGYADSYVGVYDAAGLLGPRTVLAHAIHL
ncbi:MAG: amidohydrolase family protein, partial [Myxococcales bacterium]|nr:amidohydrolase family protein [Myxococcales bacterium]